MTVGTATFYSMKGSLSSGEYPLFSSGQNLSSYAVSTQSVKYAKGLQTRINVPIFNNYETVNIVKLDDMFYWATSFQESTTYNGQVSFTLDLMAPTSLFRSGDSVTGLFHKTATNVCPYLKQSITNDLYGWSNQLYPSGLSTGLIDSASSIQGFWVEVTGFTNGNRTTLKKIGMFLGVDKTTGQMSDTRVSSNPTSSTESYPNFSDLVLNLTSETGIQADQVIDCSISYRVPYPFQVTAGIGDTRAVRIKDRSNNILSPTVNSNSHYIYDMYTLTNLTDNTSTVTVSINSDYKRQCERLEVRDWNNNAIMDIPIDGATETIYFKVHSDMTGIYTIITNKGQTISVPEGKLPYIENAWETYKAYQMEGDRTAMENAIKYAQYSKDTSQTVGILNTAINAVSTGAMTGAIAGNIPGALVGVASGIAGAGISIYESERAMELSRMQAIDQFNQSKRQAINQPQTSYNTAYGTIYAYLNTTNYGLSVWELLPRNVNATYYSNWCAEYGYPAEGKQTVTLTSGYYQGRLLSTNASQTGMYWDECNADFMRGFKFITL